MKEGRLMADDDKLYSQTQLSKKLHISQSTVTRLLRSNGFEPVKVKGRTKLYSEEQLTNLSVLQKKDRHNENSDKSNLSIFLQKEIQKLHEENDKLEENYNNQLKSKDEQIAALHKLLDQNQQLLLNTQEENKQLLALQAPVKDTQDVQEGDFKDNTDNNTADNKKTPEPLKNADKDIIDKVNGKKPWWKFWK